MEDRGYDVTIVDDTNVAERAMAAGVSKAMARADDDVVLKVVFWTGE